MPSIQRTVTTQIIQALVTNQCFGISLLLYARYKVHGCTIRVSFNVQTETAGTSVFAVGILGGDGTTIAADPQTNMEDQHSVSAILNGRNGNTGQKILTANYPHSAILV